MNNEEILKEYWSIDKKFLKLKSPTREIIIPKDMKKYLVEYEKDKRNRKLNILLNKASQAGLQRGKLELKEWCEKWWRHQETSNELWRHSTEENLIRFLNALKKEVKSQNE